MIGKTAFAIAFLLAGSASVPSWAGTAPAKFDISLDGHCDVFHLTFNSVGVWGKHSGCKYKAIDGGSVGTVEGDPVIIANDMIPGSMGVQTWYFSPPPSGAPGTPQQIWSLYVSNGNKQVIKAQGTYTLLPPGAESPTPNAPPAAGNR